MRELNQTVLHLKEREAAHAHTIKALQEEVAGLEELLHNPEPGAEA